MTTKSKRQTEGKRSTREIILEVAEQEIARNGVEGFRLKDVAEKVGVQLPSLYAHFDSRKVLLEALTDEFLGKLLDIYKELSALPPREALLASADRTIDLYLAKRGYARLLLYDFPAPNKNSILASSEDKINEILNLIEATIKRGVAQNTVRNISAELFLSFRLGLTLFPLFMRLDRNGGDMVTDREIINSIKRESNYLLAHFIAVR
ncbi:TetR/AcrR family transcriptional regulator [Cohaesibacter haloalkalitolerans]|uniref:TetR/AcrR family transcriptional regulator n=1 Tax=Cohaesibacter haloalkalitolerans TaxID=1162980 RepID=UPI000E65B4B5|nr:TetR/AcrR family transcriptional regulator [Cohaesibacter haloalkalitolerans]